MSWDFIEFKVLEFTVENSPNHSKTKSIKINYKGLSTMFRKKYKKAEEYSI